MDLLHLIAIKNNKQNVGSENRLGPFQLHDASKSSFTILIETKHPHFQNLQEGVDKSGLGCVLHLLLWTIARKVTWFSIIQT
jgi:hypothetical protein